MPNQAKSGRVLNAEEIEAIHDFISESWTPDDVRKEPGLAEVMFEYLRDLLATIAAKSS